MMKQLQNGTWNQYSIGAYNRLLTYSVKQDTDYVAVSIKVLLNFRTINCSEMI